MTQSGLCVPPGIAFVFDLDGVVVDSMPLHTEAWRIYLQQHGIAPDDIVRLMHGRRNDDIVPALFGPEVSKEEIASHGAAKEALFRTMMAPELRKYLVPGLIEFLNWCAAIPTGLASNAEPKNVGFVLDGLSIRSHFDVIIDGHQIDRPKPFPDIYLLAAEKLGVSSRNCIVFEDSPSGIEAARSAGAWVVAVGTHRGTLPATDLLIRDFCDASLLPWLQSKEPRG